MRFSALLIISSLLISACSWMPFVDSEEEQAEQTEEEAMQLSEQRLRNKIRGNLDARNWSDAIVNLNAFEAQFPFGNYADQAQLELIYVYHESTDHEAAMASAERFIRLHPRHPSVDYAYYMKGLSAALQNKGLFSNRSPIDMTKRDPGSARSAFATFSELINLYPDSAFAADARQRMLELRNRLARHEIHAANYYFKRGAYLAAANRGRYVVENFQQTPAMPDALAVMAQAYHLLALPDLAAEAERTLVANYPRHPSLNEQGEFQYQAAGSVDQAAWLSRLTFGFYVPEDPAFFDSREIYNNPMAAIHGEEDLSATPNRAAAPEAERSLFDKMTFGVFN
ncbi:MAG: outer membrane protein assembly factor BamD [Gammaproteobacteria bacterium]|nr:outer membrane protein assembly factor BamD [Gammaproteobacteria bacterium]MBQ0839429.1 outer membrane protein assembly factor BamD [Gammaproteobacteria bacterium]